MQWMHRDIKPENILMDADGNVVLADFGLAYDFSGGDLTHGPYGTPGYRSPQVERGNPYSSKTDIYSLGCLMQLMLYGSVSFLEACLLSIILMQSFYPPSERGLPLWYYKADDLLRSVCFLMLFNLYEHTDVSTQMLEEDEEHRPSAEELKRHFWFEFVYVTIPLTITDPHTDTSQRLEER